MEVQDDQDQHRGRGAEGGGAEPGNRVYRFRGGGGSCRGRTEKLTLSVYGNP